MIMLDKPRHADFGEVSLESVTDSLPPYCP